MLCLGQGWIYYEKPINSSRRVLFQLKNSSQKRSAKCDIFLGRVSQLASCENQETFPSWDYFSIKKVFIFIRFEEFPICVEYSFWEVFPNWEVFPSWEAFPADNNMEKLFPEASKQGKFSRRLSSEILWNIHPWRALLAGSRSITCLYNYSQRDYRTVGSMIYSLEFQKLFPKFPGFLNSDHWISWK